MNPLVFASIWLQILTTTNALQPRQFGGLPSKVTPGMPQIKQQAKRDIIRYGPVNVPANKDPNLVIGDGGHAHGAAPPPKGAKSRGGGLSMGAMDPNGYSVVGRMSNFCKSCTVLAGKVDVVFENGTRAGLEHGIYLHHLVAIDMSKKAPAFVKNCPGIASSISPFLGGAVDGFTQYYTTPDGKFESGYQITNSNFMMQAEIVNYRPTTQKVFLQVDVEYMPGKWGSDASQATLAATDCSSMLQSFKPAKNTVGELKSRVYPITRSGKIIAARGHMHDGGVSVTMWINGKAVCTSEATYGGAGSSLVLNGKEWQTITKMGECAGPIAVKKGDNVTITNKYDTKNHPLRESHGMDQEGMGIMTFVFVPSP